MSWKGHGFLHGDTAAPHPTAVEITPTGLWLGEGPGRIFFARERLRVVAHSGQGYAEVALPVETSLPAMPAGAVSLALQAPQAVRELARYRYVGAGEPPLVDGWLAVSAVWIAGLVALVIVGRLASDAIVRWGVQIIPVEAEAKLGDAVYERVAASQPLVDDAARNALLERAAEVVESFPTDRPFDVRISIARDDSTMNAFALPGGRIVLYTGILQRMEHEDELWGLLAHEGGHVHLRHGLRQLVRGALLSFAVSLLSGDTSGLSSILISNGGSLLRLAYSRSDETQADNYAFDALLAQGRNPQGMIHLFERMEQSARGLALPAFLSTHPDTRQRIHALERRLQATPAPATATPVFTPEEWRLLTRGE